MALPLAWLRHCITMTCFHDDIRVKDLLFSLKQNSLHPGNKSELPQSYSGLQVRARSLTTRAPKACDYGLDLVRCFLEKFSLIYETVSRP